MQLWEIVSPNVHVLLMFHAFAFTTIDIMNVASIKGPNPELVSFLSSIHSMLNFISKDSILIIGILGLNADLHTYM